MMKAQGALLLTILLILVTVIIISSLQFFWQTSTERRTEVQFSEDIYVTQNALKLSKLYVESAMDYSVYQAMFDTGRNELPSSDSVLTDKLAEATAKNMKKYTESGYNFIGKTISLPQYAQGSIIIKKTSDNRLNVSASASGNIYHEETLIGQMENKLVRLGLDSKIERIYPFDYFSLYDKALSVLNGLKDCTSETKTDGSYAISLDAKKKSKPCIVKISVTDTSRKFPVFNGTSVAFENIGFAFNAEVTEAGATALKST